MKELRQAAVGIGMALLFSAIVLGSLSVSLLEGAVPLALAPQPTATITPGMFPLTTGRVELVTLAPSPTEPLVQEPTLTFTPPPNCIPPAGWVAVTVLPDETIESLARVYQIDPAELARANCLVTTTLLPDTVIYVPNTQPTATQAPRCGPPAGWVRYTVRPGDTLTSLSLRTGAAVPHIQHANCLGSKIIVNAGQMLYLPFIPAPLYTPYPTATRWLYPTWTVTFTPWPPTRTPVVPPSATPYIPPSATAPVPASSTPNASPSPTSAGVPSDTPVPLPSDTPVPPPSDTPVPPPSNTPVPPPSDTPVPPPSNTPVPPPSNTPVPPPSATPVTPPPYP